MLKFIVLNIHADLPGINIGYYYHELSSYENAVVSWTVGLYGPERTLNLTTGVRVLTSGGLTCFQDKGLGFENDDGWKL